MRALSLYSDLEHEVWFLMKELIDEHQLSVRTAAEAVRHAVSVNERDMKSND